MSDKIAGRNSVLEALRAGREINKILVVRGSKEGSIREIIALSRDKKIPLQEVEASYLDKLIDGSHQGVVAFASAKEYVAVEDILERASQREEDPFIILLDGLEDPHNLGAILRTAEASGAHGVIIPKRRSVSLTPTVAKTSAGAVEYVPVARVSNLVQTMECLKERGCWLVGADMDGEIYWDQELTGPLGLVIGGEGKGMSRLVKQKCDFLVSLPMKGRLNSLNASVAASLLMYEILRQREKLIHERDLNC